MARHGSGGHWRLVVVCGVVTLTSMLLAGPAQAGLLPIGRATESSRAPEPAPVEEVAANAPAEATTSTHTPAPQPTSTEPVAAIEAPPCARGRTEHWVCVDLTSRRAWLMNKDAPVEAPIEIRSGSGEINPETGVAKVTPVGVFPVQWKHAEHQSSEYRIDQNDPNSPGAYMPYSVFWHEGGIAIHGARSLENPSAGCIKLKMPFVDDGLGNLVPNYAADSAPRRFYEFLDVDDEVHVIQT